MTHVQQVERDRTRASWLDLDRVSTNKLLRTLALAFLLAHLAAAVASAATLLMLHGDGSWFVFALTLDEPWALKWRGVAARATTYVATVVPTAAVADLLRLSPTDVARLNGLIFYGAPGLLFAAAASMVWRERPAALYFLLLQALAGFAIGFGFPSEILLAPGFLWIALFSVEPARAPSPLFLLAYTATVFSHELATPAALVAAFYAWRRSNEAPGRSLAGRLGVAALLGLPILAMILVRQLGGAEGSNSNAIFVVDPRRVFNNPTLWLFAGAVPVVYLFTRCFPRLRGRLGLCFFALASLSLVLLVAKLVPELNFADGRYDGRSLIALSMAALAALYVRDDLSTRTADAAMGPTWVSHEVVGWSLPFIGAVTGIVLASTALFLADWRLSVRGMLRVVAPSASARSVQFIAFGQALNLMSRDEARANRRMHFEWVAPYRAFVLADGQTPGRVLVGDGNYNRFCTRSAALRLGPGPYPPGAFNAWKAFSCNYVRPPSPDTMSKRLLRKLKQLTR